MSNWRPSSTGDARVARAKLYGDIRTFFQTLGFVEVDPPLLGRSGSTDPHIHSFTTSFSGNAADNGGEDLYLQSSPEFFMKRLLAAGSGPIYAITKSFRRHELGCFHNPEFTILEWYQPGFDDHALMAQVGDFVKTLLAVDLVNKTYRECFLQTFDLNPHTATLKILADRGRQYLNVDWRDVERDTWLEALFSHIIQPTLEQATIVYDYPASQAALAKITPNSQGELIARRFEVFMHGIELGNGYWELTDGEEQRHRFHADNNNRKSLGLDQVTIDTKLVDALTAGMPDCAGIAFGLDRLLMIKMGAKRIESVMDFPADRL